MRKYIILVIFLNSVLYSATQSNENLYRIPTSAELISPGIEHGAYEDFIRIISEINKDKNYLSQSSSGFSQRYDNVDFVPVAQFNSVGSDGVEKEIEYFGSKKDPVYKNQLFTIYDFDKNPDNFIKPEVANDLSYVRAGSEKRFYFGNGNRVKDIIILDKNDFANIDKKDILYNIDGVYKTISPRNRNNLNPLGITLDEYHNIIEKNTANDINVLNFLKTKIKDAMNIDTVLENGNLYTVDEKGNKHRVLWNFEPVSIPNEDHFLDKDSNQRYDNVVLNNVYIFSPIKVGGKITYKNDGSIIIENPNDAKDTPTIAGWNKYDTLQDYELELANDPNSWSIADKFKTYINDKKTLSEAEFNAKYGDGLKNDPNFKAAFEGYHADIKLAVDEKTIIDEQIKEIKNKKTNLENNPNMPDDYYIYMSSWSDEATKQEYFNKQSTEAQKVLLEYKTLDDLYKPLDQKSSDLYTKITETIPKQYGFYTGWWVSDPSENKYASLVLKDSEIAIKRISKNIEFRGKGRVDGTIDLGSGENYLTIAEQFTGNYGTNITFGSDVVLKNIKAIKVGGQVDAAKGGHGLSGKTSLSIEVDPNKLDLEGYLYKHALRNTWSDTNKIIFSNNNTNYNYASDFGIELKVSQISKDNIINMGRPLVYKANPLDYDQSAAGAPKVNELMDYKISLYSDSITHNLKVLKKTSNEGYSLVQVKVLDKIKRLNDKENDVYKSIKNSGNLGFLSNTVSSSTKKTIFSAEEDKEANKNTEVLVKSIVSEKSAQNIINELSHFDFNKEKNDLMLSSINNLRELSNVKSFNEQVNNLAKYQNYDFSKLIKAIDDMNLDSLVSDGKIIDRNMATEDGVKAKIEEMKKYYNDNINAIYEELESLKPSNSDEDIKAMKDLRDSLSMLGYESTFWIPEPDKKLSDYVQKYKDIKIKIQKIKGITNDDLVNVLVKELERLENATNKNYAFKNLVENLYFTKREEESLRELKTLLAEIYEKNIYSEVNKISKNGLEVFTPLAFNPQNKPHAGVISGRYSKDKFKGNIYTAYGVYEFSNDLNSSGFIVGGGSSNHKEVKNDTLKQLTTESKISGKRAYLGVFNNHHINDNFSNIFGLGVQYSKYKVDRDFRNNYQRELYKGKLNTIDLNVYAGGVFKYNLDDDLVFNTKALLSYMLVHQGKVSEEKQPLSMNIDKKNFSYLDASMGVGLAKMIYSDDSTSSISADVYGIYGIYGYNNDDLRARFNDSTTDFDILGNKYKRSSMKIELEYNVLKTNGFDYGLSGNYITNANENNIAIKFKAGYKF